nr:serine carboxypeptidase-like [Ipomoea batatas]
MTTDGSFRFFDSDSDLSWVSAAGGPYKDSVGFGAAGERRGGGGGGRRRGERGDGEEEYVGDGAAVHWLLFYENGPFYIADNQSLIWNDYGWDKASNLIYVDATDWRCLGFSYSSSDKDLRTDENGVSNDLYMPSYRSFSKAHPEYAKNDFFITGESYAGHYIPALGSRVNQGNKKKEGIPINLKGMAIGNGLTNTEIQYPAYPDFALDNKLISKSDHDNLTQLVPDCEEAIRQCNSVGGDACDEADNRCETIYNQILGIAKNINHYDIRRKCDGGSSLCYNFSSVGTFLKTQSVKDALGVGDINWVSCSFVVYDYMSSDWFKNLAVGIPSLLEDGINLLVYAGEYDLICNWLGNWRWVEALKWSGQGGFGAAPNVTFSVDGKENGIQKSYGPLTFLKVHDAGHMVPMDQPQVSLEMLRRWMHGQLSKP